MHHTRNELIKFRKAIQDLEDAVIRDSLGADRDVLFVLDGIHEQISSITVAVSRIGGAIDYRDRDQASKRAVACATRALYPHIEVPDCG